MKLYKATIEAKSNFATPLRGDTLFGQICWYIRLLEGEQKLKELLEKYKEKPFCVVSDGFVTGHLPKPKLPSWRLGEDASKKKENRKRVWLEIGDFFEGAFTKAKRSDEVAKEKEVEIVRNSINYKTSRTDGADFSPYGVEEYRFGQKDVYFLMDEVNKELVKKAFRAIGEDGYGKDKTIGKGRFEIVGFEEFKLPKKSSKQFMTLSPIYPKGLECKEFYYDIFVRFGKLGMDRATTNPFKKPILFADTAAAIEFEEERDIGYVGRALSKIATYEDAVQQGYAIILPTKWE